MKIQLDWSQIKKDCPNTYQAFKKWIKANAKAKEYSFTGIYYKYFEKFFLTKQVSLNFINEGREGKVDYAEGKVYQWEDSFMASDMLIRLVFNFIENQTTTEKITLTEYAGLLNVVSDKYPKSYNAFLEWFKVQGIELVSKPSDFINFLAEKSNELEVDFKGMLKEYKCIHGMFANTSGYKVFVQKAFGVLEYLEPKLNPCSSKRKSSKTYTLSSEEYVRLLIEVESSFPYSYTKFCNWIDKNQGETAHSTPKDFIEFIARESVKSHVYYVFQGIEQTPYQRLRGAKSYTEFQDQSVAYLKVFELRIKADAIIATETKETEDKELQTEIELAVAVATVTTLCGIIVYNALEEQEQKAVKSFFQKLKNWLKA